MICRTVPVVLLLFAILVSPVFPADHPAKELPQNYPELRHTADSLVPDVYIDGVPDVEQMNSYSCGPAAFQCVLHYFGQDGFQEDYAKALGTTPDNGTHETLLAKGLVKAKLNATIVTGMTREQLKEYIRNRNLVIIDYQAWSENTVSDYSKDWDDGHYSVAIGYNKDVLFIEDPMLLGTVGYLPWDEFEKRWHDFDTENGQRREYVHMGIVVTGRHQVQPKFTKID
ncbi:MAG: C39 family peptidase [Candidatus Riflebacteria bacterium]|nr:C39 family peptidase [Candidatus Riflebacteria bacterium]